MSLRLTIPPEGQPWLHGPFQQIEREFETVAGILAGDLATIGLFTAASTQIIPATTTHVRTSGHLTEGVGGADYIYSATVNAAYVAANPYISFRSANGRGFKLVRDQRLSLRMFGAVGDGVANDTAPFHAALTFVMNFYTRVLPYGGSSHGEGTLYIDRGKYKITAQFEPILTDAYSAIGLNIIGEGQYASSLEFHNDSAAFWKQRLYINWTLQDLYIVHVPQNPDPLTWTNRCIEIDGAGGGRKFQMFRVATKNFATVVKTLNNINEDTFHFEHCEFYDYARDGFFTRNSQNLSNTFINCTWCGIGESIFNYAGMGHTHIEGGVSLIDGAWLKPHGGVITNGTMNSTTTVTVASTAEMYVKMGVTGVGIPANTTIAAIVNATTITLSAAATVTATNSLTFGSDKWGSSAVITLVNFKGECRNWSNYAGGSRSSILSPFGEWSLFFGHQVIMIGCGLSGGVALDPLYYQIETNPGIDLQWNGGQLIWTAKFKTRSAGMIGRNRGLAFSNLRECPLPSNLTRDDTAAGHQPSVSFENCINTGGTERITNITLSHATAGKEPVTLLNAEHQNQIAPLGGNSQALIAFNPTYNLSLPFYGYKQTVRELEFVLTNKAAASGNITFQIYSDAAKTILIDTVKFTNAESGPLARFSYGVMGKTSTEGVYITATATSTHFGHIFLRNRAGGGVGAKPVFAPTVESQTATYTELATAGEKVVKCSNTMTVNLPTAAGNTAMFHFKLMTAASTLTIDASGAETIDGALTLTTSTQYTTFTLVSDGANWVIV